MSIIKDLFACKTVPLIYVKSAGVGALSMFFLMLLFWFEVEALFMGISSLKRADDRCGRRHIIISPSKLL